MIKTCYTNIESFVKVNEFTSIYFNFLRGTREGCPISTCFILVAETLAEAVRVESEIKEGRKEMFYLTTHSTHFIYGYMVSNIWLRTIQIVRKETLCHHVG